MDNSSSSLHQSATTTTTTRTVHDVLLFFCCGIGSSLCYIATLSSLVYFKYEFGSNSYVYLNFAIYFPLLPISLGQAKWDQEYDKSLGSYRSYMLRGIIGFIISVIATAFIPILVVTDSSNSSHSSLPTLIGLSTLQGGAGAMLQGTFNQLASFVPDVDGSLKAAVASGLQASALLVLIVSIYTGFGNRHSALGFHTFFYIIAIIELILLILFLILMCNSQLISISMIKRDLSFHDDHIPLLLLDEENNNSEEKNENTTLQQQKKIQIMQKQDYFAISYQSSFLNYIIDDDEEEEEKEGSATQQHQQSASYDLTYKQLWDVTSLCCYTMVLTLIPSFVVGSWFAHVETHWVALPQWLFYIRIGSDFLGRIATVPKIIEKPISVKFLFISSILRLIPTILFFVNASTSSQTSDNTFFSLIYNDQVSIILAGIIAFTSGYQVTRCFQLAPDLLYMEHRDRNVAKQTSLLNVSFSIAAFMGVFLSMTLLLLV